MPKKRYSSSASTNLRVGNISGVDGDVNIAGGNITTHKTIARAVEIGQLFDEVYAKIETLPKTSPHDKKNLKAEVKVVQTMATATAQKRERLAEGLLEHHFRNIARMAPDILDVVVATLANPLLGLGTAARRIAARAREEAGG